MKEIVVRLNDNTIALLKNDGVSIVQKLFTDNQVFIISIQDIKKILSEHRKYKKEEK